MRDLNELALEPVIRSFNTGQFDISHWFSCGADRRVYSHVITKISQMDRLPVLFILGMGLCSGLSFMTK